MTQAFNLSQLANKVNSSGQLNAATGLTGIVPVANGGTGISAVGAAGNILTSNGTAWVSQAASAGFSGATINSPSASTLTLTSASAQCQIVQFTSATNSIVILPNATTLLYKGAPIYRIINESQCNAPIFVRDSAGNWLATVPVNEGVDVTLQDNSTAAGTWSIDYVDQLPIPASVENASISAIFQTSYATNSNQQAYATEPQVCALTDSTYVFAWNYLESSNNRYPRQAIVAATLTGNTFSFGTVSFQAPIGNPTSFNLGYARVFRLNSTTAIVEYRAFGSYGDCVGSYGAYYNRCAAVTVSGNTVTVGGYNSSGFPESGYVGYTNGNYLEPLTLQGFRIRVSDTSFASVYHTATINQTQNWPNCMGGNLNCLVTSVSGTTQTNGTAVTLAANNGNIMGITSHTDNAFIITYYTSSSAGASTGIRKAVTCNISGTVPTWGTVASIDISNVTTNASAGQYFNGVTLSATKVCLPTYQITGSGNLWTIGTFTISGATNAYVANSDCNMNNQYFSLFPRSASSFLSRLQNFINSQNPIQTGGIGLTKYGVNANNGIYPDTNYTFQNNAQLGGTFATDFLAMPATSTSTVGVLSGGVYNASPAGTTMYMSKGTLPT